MYNAPKIEICYTTGLLGMNCFNYGNNFSLDLEDSLIKNKAVGWQYILISLSNFTSINKMAQRTRVFAAKTGDQSSVFKAT